MEVTSKMDFLDHGPNNIIIKVENRKSLLIVELTKYDDWFHQQVNCNSNQVNEKMDHLTDQINLEILSEKCFNLLLKQVQQWYAVNGDSQSLTDFNYKIKAEIEPQSG